MIDPSHVKYWVKTHMIYQVGKTSHLFNSLGINHSPAFLTFISQHPELVLTLWPFYSLVCAGFDLKASLCTLYYSMLLSFIRILMNTAKLPKCWSSKLLQAVRMFNLVPLGSGASFKSWMHLMVNIRKTGCIYIHSYFCEILLSAYAMDWLEEHNSTGNLDFPCHCSKKRT